MEQNLNQGGAVENQIGDGAKKNTGMIVGMVACVILALGGVGFGVYGMMQSSEKDSQISDLKVQIKESDETTATVIETPDVENRTEISENVTQQEDDSGYLKLPKVGLMIPLSQEIIDKLSLAELDNGYRFDVKTIANYREQGHCGNGGSGAIGIISKETVDIVKDYIGGSDNYTKTKSKWFDTTIATFKNNVVYPKEYVTFSNLDAVCYDLGSGGTERGQEVSKEVQEINNALETAFVNAKPIK